MDYSNEQKAWAVIWYGISGSPKAVQIEYRKKFGIHSVIPIGKSIKRWWSKFIETNNLNNRKKGKTNWVRTELKVEQVLAVFNKDPHASLRSVSKPEGMPLLSMLARVFGLIQDCKFHPYKMQHAQKPRN